jgi:hypothetical protein
MVLTGVRIRDYPQADVMGLALHNHYLADRKAPTLL